MPRKTRAKRVRRAGRKRGFKRSRYPRYRAVATLMPKTHKVKLRYADSCTITPMDATAPYWYLYRANDMYDPDSSGTGHQPLGFDQYMAFYNHFTVVGSKIKVTPVNDSQSTSNNTITGGGWGIALLSTAGEVTSYSSATQLIEGKQMRSGWRQGAQSAYSNLADQKPLHYNFSMKREFGKFDINDAQFKGTTSGSPTELSFYGVWYSGWGANTPAIVRFIVEISYIAILTEPKFIAQS